LGGLGFGPGFFFGGPLEPLGGYFFGPEHFDLGFFLGIEQGSGLLLRGPPEQDGQG
jgi:hypothetical protein